MDIKKRLKNVAFWLAVASFIALVAQTFGVKIDLGKYNEIVNAGLGLLVFLGILNNPTTNNKGFGDDVKE